MNKEQIIDWAESVYKRQLQKIEQLPDDFEGAFGLEGCTIRLGPGTYADNLVILRTLRMQMKTTYEIRTYFMHEGCLTIYYNFDNGLVLNMDCTDYEHTLKLISGGKCKIVTNQPEPELEVVCNLTGHEE